MAQGEIEIRISPDGSEVEAEGKNFKGPACLDFMGDVLKSLGEPEIKKKPEYHLKGGSGVKVGA